MPLRPEAATRRVQLAMARGEVPFREGHSVYMNRIEGQVRLRTADGNLTNAGREYIQRGGDERLTHLIAPNTQTFRRGQQVMAYGIQDRHGAGRPFRVHTENLQGPHTLTHAGRLFSGHEQTEFVVKVPVFAKYWHKDGGGGHWSEEHTTHYVQGEGQKPITVPITDIPGLPHISSGYTDEGQEEITRKVKAATQLWVQQKIAEQVEKAHAEIHLDDFDDEPLQGFALAIERAKALAEADTITVLYQESGVIYYLKGDADITAMPGWSFDELRTFRDHGRPQTHVLLGLPRRGIADMPDDMWGKLKLCPEATRDYRSEGKNCMVQQIAVAFKQQYKPRAGSSRDGAERTKEQVPQFSVDDVVWHLHLIFDDLHPGYYTDEAGNRKEPKRASLSRDVPKELDAFAEAWKLYFPRMKRVAIADLRKLVDKGHCTRYGFTAKAFHDALKRAFLWFERDLLKMYTLFFQGYPWIYSVSGGFVAACWHHYEGEDEERWNEPKGWPYTHAGWEELGPSSRMVIELCRRAGRRCRLVHIDRVIYEHVPEVCVDDAWIVWAVYTDHAFFVEDAKGIQHMQVKQPKDDSAPMLQRHLDPDDCTFKKVEYKDMEPWDSGRFMELFDKKEGGTFQTADINAAAAWLRWKKVQFFPAYRDPNHMKCITVGSRKGGARITIKDVPPAAGTYELICEEAAKRYGVPFPYFGEQKGGLAIRLVEFLLAKRRSPTTPSCDTTGLCAECGDPLDGEFERHHPVQPMCGGDPEQVVALHPWCHAYITALQKMGMNSAGKLSFYSELSPEETLIWEQTPKPRQIHWGDGKASGLLCIDVKNCRPSMLCSEARLPMEGPMDGPVPFCLDKFLEYDYFTVNRPILRQYSEGEDLTDIGVYQGRQLYCLSAVKHMLDVGTITYDCIEDARKMSRFIPGEVMRHAFDELKTLVKLAYGGLGCHETEEHVVVDKKTFVLSCIGAMNGFPREEWTVRAAAEAHDCPDASIVSLDLDKAGLPKARVPRRVFDNRTAYPIGLIALQKEVCAVDYAARCIKRLGQPIHGMVVDCVVFSLKLGKCEAEERTKLKKTLKEDLTALLGGNTLNAKYEYKKQVTPAPCCKQGKAKPAPKRPPLKPWIKVDEQDKKAVEELRQAANARHLPLKFPPDVKNMIAEFVGDGPFAREDDDILRKLAVIAATNKGALTTGPPGTGKTKFLSELIPARKALGRANFLCGAYTIAASRLMPNGRTLEHYRRAYARRIPANTALAIDEVNMVGIGFLSHLARFVRFGTEFYPMGDYVSQETPIFDSWSCDNIGETDLIRQLGRSLHITLSRNRRYNDEGLWNNICRLFSNIDNPGCVEQLQRQYPWNGEEPDLCLVKSHRKRRMINAFLNRRDMDGVFIESPGKIGNTTLQPQPMFVKPGMILLGCAGSKKKIVSGLEYAVQSVDAETVVVSMRPPWRTSDVDRATLDAKALAETQRAEDNIELSHAETGQWLRLAYAATFYAIEGRTIPDRTILVLDTANRFFNNRNLMVGISRAKEGRAVKIPTPDQEAVWLAAMPEVPDEVEKSAPEEDFEPENFDPAAGEED